MKRKTKTRWISTLLAVLMFISMLNVFSVSLVWAEETSSSLAADKEDNVSDEFSGLTATTGFTPFNALQADWAYIEAVINYEDDVLNGIFDFAQEDSYASTGILKENTENTENVVNDEAVKFEATKGEYITSTAHFSDYYTLPWTGYRWDLKDGSYTISSREEMDLFAKLLYAGVDFSGVTIYQSADIDMKWEPFVGLGLGHPYTSSTNVDLTGEGSAYTVRPFNGTFDGNGFVIKGLYIIGNDTPYVGLFGSTRNATIKNVGISSGFIAGQECTGSLVGELIATGIYNCWNAATVWGGGENGTGGLVGRFTWASKMYNCYNLGLVYNSSFSAGGLCGWMNDGKMYNCYNWGQIVTGITYAYKLGNSINFQYSAVARLNMTVTKMDFANNYYRQECGMLGSVKDLYDQGFSTKANDRAKGIGSDAVADLVAGLNDASVTDKAVSSLDQMDGYDVQFEASNDDKYAALAYYKNGALAVKREAVSAVNVGENTWAEKSALFAEICEKAGTSQAYTFPSLEVKDADDLFILGLLTSFMQGGDDYKLRNVEITSDIDMSTLELLPVQYFVSIAGGYDFYDAESKPFTNPETGTTNTNDFYAYGYPAKLALKAVIDGNYHTITNWKTYAIGRWQTRQGGFITALGDNGAVKNLGLIDTVSEYSQYDLLRKYSLDESNNVVINASNELAYNYASLLVERTGGVDVIIRNCFTTGNLVIHDSSSQTRNNDSGILGRTWSKGVCVENCWTDCTVTYDDFKGKARAIGSCECHEDSTTECSVANRQRTNDESLEGYLLYYNVYYVRDSVENSPYINPGNPVADLPYILQANCLENANAEWQTDAYQYTKAFSYWLNNQFGEFMFTRRDNGDIDFADQDENGEFTNATRRVVHAKTLQDGTVIEPLKVECYENGGVTVSSVSTEVDAGDYKKDFPGAAVPRDDDLVIPYKLGSDDLETHCETLRNFYASLGDMEFIRNDAEHKYIYQMLCTLHADGKCTQDNLKLIADYMNTTPMQLEDNILNAVYAEPGAAYPNYPRYASKDSCADLFAVCGQFTDFVISSEADWLAAVDASFGDTLAGITLHVNNDIEIKDAKVRPLGGNEAYKFAGKIDGHGHTITINMQYTAYQKSGTTADDDKSRTAGLLGWVYGGTIQNLGVAGSVNVTVEACDQDAVGIAGLVGYAQSGAKIIGCWNNAEINVTLGTAANDTSSKVSIASIVGRGENNTIIAGCYNTGTINASEFEHASAFNDWAQKTGQVYNCYNTGNILAKAVYFVRYNAEADGIGTTGVAYGTNPIINVAYNLYDYSDTTYKTPAIANFNTRRDENGNTLVGEGETGDYYDCDKAYTQYSEAPDNSELAYLLNTESRSAITEMCPAAGEVYFTLESGEVIVGTSENQTRKVTLPETDPETEGQTCAYCDQGEEYTLTLASPVTVTYGEGNSYYATGSFIMPASDVTIEYVEKNTDLENLAAMAKYWIGKRVEYFDFNVSAVQNEIDNSDPEAAPVEDNIVALYNNGLMSVSKAEAAKSLYEKFGSSGTYKADEEGYPHGAYVAYHTDATGYRIASANDLAGIAAAVDVVNDLDADLYIVQNVNMDLLGGEQFIIRGLKVDVVGNGHNIAGYTYRQETDFITEGETKAIMPALFSEYAGSSISDLTMKNAYVSGGYAVAPLISSYAGEELTVKNVAVTDSYVRKGVYFPEDLDETQYQTQYPDGVRTCIAMGGMIGQAADGSIKMENCSVENTTLDLSRYYTKGDQAQNINAGFVIGHVGAGATLDEISVRNNVFYPNAFAPNYIALGYLAGEVAGSNETTIRNSIVYSNVTKADDCLAASEVKTVEGIQSIGENYGLLVGGLKDQSLTVYNVMVADNDAANAPLIGITESDEPLYTLTSDYLYYDREVGDDWKQTGNGTETNANAPKYYLTDEFRYGNAPWDANNSIENSMETLQLKKWTNIHSDTYRTTKIVEELPLPTIAQMDGATYLEEPTHRMLFDDAVGDDETYVGDISRYSDSIAMLILLVEEMDDPTQPINDIPWKDCIGNMKNYVHTNLTGDVVIPSVVAQYTYISLSLDTSIGMNFFVQIHPDFRDTSAYQLTTTHSLTWKDSFALSDDADGVLEKGESVIECIQADAKNYYHIKLPLNANEMWRSFYVQLTDKAQANFTYKLESGSTADYSEASKWGYIKNYVQTILQNTEKREDYAEAAELVAAMLNYGNEVRDRFWLGGDDRPWIDELKSYGYPLYSGVALNMFDNTFTDKVYTAAEKAEYTAALSGYSSSGTKIDDELAYSSSTLVFDSKIAIRHYFTYQGTASEEGLAEVNEKYSAVVNASDASDAEKLADLTFQYDATQKEYYIEYSDIAAYELDALPRFIVAKGGTPSEENYILKLTYGAFSYARSMWNKQSQIQHVAVALYRYWAEAKAYYDLKSAVIA